MMLRETTAVRSDNQVKHANGTILEDMQGYAILKQVEHIVNSMS